MRLRRAYSEDYSFAIRIIGTRSVDPGQRIGLSRARMLQQDVRVAKQESATSYYAKRLGIRCPRRPAEAVRRIRSSYPWLHWWTGRAFLIASLIVGCSALAMSWNNFVWSVFSDCPRESLPIRAAARIRPAPRVDDSRVRDRSGGCNDPADCRWLLRGGTGARATAEAAQFFGTAFWICFTLHLIAAEAWINYTRPAMQASAA